MTQAVNIRELAVFSREEATAATVNREALAEAVDRGPFGTWGGRCHEISLALLRTGLVGRGRVARGTCEGVTSQHSWIVLGDNPYDRKAVIVDPTLWSYRDDVWGVYVGRRNGHRPHGDYSCFDSLPPSHHGGPDIELTPAEPLSPQASSWLATIGPLDLRGWIEVAHLGVHDWPSRAIITAIRQTPELKAFVPIDIAGMLTGENPNDFYW